jgi:hypothetical protein
MIQELLRDKQEDVGSILFGGLMLVLKILLTECSEDGG